MPTYTDDEIGRLRRDIDEARARHGRRSEDAVMLKRLQIVVTVVAILTTMFTAGYNWRKIEEIAAAQSRADAAFDKLPNTYVRQDVDSAWHTDMNRRFDDMAVQMAELKTLLQRRDRER